MVIEETSGKPVKPASLTDGIASMQQRIGQLEAEKTKLLDRRDEDFDATLKDHLASINKDLAATRKCLADYAAQLGKQNRSLASVHEFLTKVRSHWDPAERSAHAGGMQAMADKLDEIISALKRVLSVRAATRIAAVCGCSQREQPM